MSTNTEMKVTADSTGRQSILRILGVGTAGCNALGHMARGGFDGTELIALNSDVQALADSPLDLVVPLGARLTRGLGAGGNPESGRAAAEDEAETVRKLCAGARVVMVVAGLGGGFGTGAAPVIARTARESGALVLGIALLPFDCEGTHRRNVADSGLAELKEAADAVLCLSNQRILKLIHERTSLVETFAIANDLLAESTRGIGRLLAGKGIINVDFADLCALVRGRHADTCFATVEARGENRVREAIDKLAAHPLLDQGATLADADGILVSITGGMDLGIAEVDRVMNQINRAADHAQIVMGAAIEPEFDDRLSVTVVVTHSDRQCMEPDRSHPMEFTDSSVQERERSASGPVPEDAAENSGIEGAFFQDASILRSAPRFVAPPPALSAEQKERLLAKQGGRQRRKSKSNMRQGTLPLEIVSKGRFEKSEPTVHHGEDLDVPTYIRRGMAMN